MSERKKVAKKRRKKIKLPKLPEIPEHPCGHEIKPEDARALIEGVAQEHFGIGWQEFRQRWNHNDFTPEETEELRPLVSVALQFAVINVPRPDWS